MLKRSIVILWVLLSWQFSFGQSSKTYSGNYNSLNFHGSSTYQYNEDNTEQRIFNGQFSFTTPTGSVSITGAYYNNFKNGLWKFSLTNIKNTDLLMNNNISAIVLGSFNQGALNGAWTLSRTKIITFSNNGISNSYKEELNGLSYLFSGKVVDFNKATTVIEKSNANFYDNHFIGTFNYNVNDDSKVSGQFNDSGYFNGIWTITYYQDQILHFQKLEYMNGVLMSIKNKDNSTGEVTTIYDKSNEVQEFFRNYNSIENSSKVGSTFFKLSNGKSNNSNIQFLEDAIAIWYNNSSLTTSAYINEIDRGTNKMTIYPERIIVNDDDKSTTVARETSQRSEKINDSIIASNNSNQVFTIVQQMPAFPGDVNKYLAKNIHYPEAEMKAQITGTVYVNFIVEKDGSLSNVKVLKGIADGPGLNKEAIRVISAMPKWSVGMQNGNAVRVSYNIPIRFVLN